MTMHLRIKQTTQRDNRQTLIVVFTAFVIANIIVVITAMGLPTGPDIKSQILDILLGTSLNVVGFALFITIFSIILSLLFIPLPKLLTSAIVYNGILFGIILNEANAGMNFSIFIGVVTTILSLIFGNIVILLLKSKVLRLVFLSLVVILGFVSVTLYFTDDSIFEVTNYKGDHPTQEGDYDISFFTYGSGTDIHREVFGNETTETTDSVNASHFLTDWSEKREDFWGFEQENLPINGRVWMPEGKGDFPIILMVHGNHTMENFSTDGYDYLGELIASQGFIFISVDEDFVNYSNFAGEPNDNYKLRSWLLLQHLVQLKELNNNLDSNLYQKINFDNVALAGHSRGGQAAAMAAAYESFFEDSNLISELNDINIKAVAAISPTDKLIDGQRATLDNIAYMVLQGSADSDIYDFRGNKQFHRTHLTRQSNLFKVAIYIENANHAQFNTSWGKNDFSFPRGIFLDRLTLMNKRDQQFIAETYFSAFFKKVFNESSSNDALFRNSNVYLKDTEIISQYYTSHYQTFEEFNNFDELKGVLKGFEESKVIIPKGRSQKEHPQKILVLSWENEASYSIQLTTDDLKNMRSNQAEYITLSLANALPDSHPNLKVTLESSNHATIQYDSSIGEVIEIDNTVFGLFDGFFREGKYEQSWEPIFETIEIPIDEFKNVREENINLTIQLSNGKGKVMLEEIGFY